VNLDRVERVLHGARGALTLVLTSGVQIPVSQKHRPALRERLGL
jgi:DNA-binding LytR/AlgR family response regulator